MADKYLTPFARDMAGAKEFTGLGQTSIFAALKAGKLKGRKFGRKLVFLDADLRAFVDSLPLARPDAATK